VGGSDSGGLRERLMRSRILGPGIAQQVAEELDLHRELLRRELVEEGMSEAQARAAVAQQWSDQAEVAAVCSRIARGTERRWRVRLHLAELGQDLGYGLRQLARARGFAAVALLTLATGIGATTAIWSVVEGVVLRRFPFAHPERVVCVQEEFQQAGSDFSVGNFVDLEAAAPRAVAALAAMHPTAVNLAEGEVPERLAVARVTHGFFDVFGVRPELGRTFAADEDQPGRDQEVIVSHALWVSHLGADPAILQRTLHLSGHPYRVVGVMPAGFDPTLSQTDAWLPLPFTPAERAQHDDHFLTIVALLRPGAGAAAAQSEIGAVVRHLAELYPEGNVARTGARVRPLSELLIGGYRQRLFVLLGAVGLVLLIACANVASLLLVRGSARSRELAIRVAVGAGGRRIVRQLLAESAALALAGGALGVGLAALAVQLCVRLAPGGIPRLAETRIDGGVLLFALAVSIAASLLFGTAPALRAARQDPQTLLRASAAAQGPVRDRMRSLLVMAEIALALVLLIGAGLLIRSALHLQRTPVGFDSADLLAARLTLPEASYPRPAAVAQTFAALAEQLAQAPGVRAAAAVSAAPLGPGGFTNGLFPAGRATTAENLIDARLHLVTPGYFATLRVPLLAGRPFTAADGPTGQRVMIVSRELARRAWGDADPIGRRVACCEGSPQDPGWKTVVGVAGDVLTHGPAEPVAAEFYLPLSQAPPDAWTWTERTMTLVARGGDPRRLAAAMRGTVGSVDRSLPLTLTTMDEALQGSTAVERFHTLLLLTLGLLGLFLAAVGTYGVVAFFIGLRTREIGIRMALGANRRDILRLLARQGVRLVLGGLAAGTAGALLATRWLQGSLHGVSPTDPGTFVCVTLVLAATAACAVLVPALAATRIDPRQAFQQT
jgi:putative ABC transport system permease protein